jgi:hypothetical protein
MIIRDQIVVGQGEHQSVDVVASDGQLLMRLNIFNHVSSGPSVDVIFDPGHLTNYHVQS